MGKLVSLGVPDMYLDFLNAYLDSRVGYVTVEGAFSDAFVLTNQVLQGTVLGPALWNTFFGDVAIEAASGDGTPRKLADNLNVFQKFPIETSSTTIFAKITTARTNVHKWGQRNRFIFDVDREHVAIIHPVQGEGGMTSKC